MADEIDGGSAEPEEAEVSGEIAQEDIPADAEDASPDAVAAVAGLSGDQFQALLAARDQLEQQMLPSPDAVSASAADTQSAGGGGNVVGIGIGEKVVDGEPTGRLAIKVFVKQKLDESAVDSQAMVPATVGDIETDVEETGEIEAFMFNSRQRPAPCGVSIGNCNVNLAGTLGCLVRRGSRTYLLSNNHVMAAVNQGPVGVGIPQPGLFDSGTCPGDVIAELTRWIAVSFTGPNLVDCAIARVSDLSLVNACILRDDGSLATIVLPIVAPALNLAVQKSGRTTQNTQGAIDAVNITINVGYGPGQLAQFRHQFRVRGNPAPFSDHGDSGSLVTTVAGNQPVGLLFAGNAATNVTFVNPINTVLNAFGVGIVTA
ncbi:MAG TPA: hypothetical protein VIH93_12185 [Thermoanaerobaculia bacterium]